MDSCCRHAASPPLCLATKFAYGGVNHLSLPSLILISLDGKSMINWGQGGGLYSWCTFLAQLLCLPFGKISSSPVLLVKVIELAKVIEFPFPVEGFREIQFNSIWHIGLAAIGKCLWCILLLSESLGFSGGILSKTRGKILTLPVPALPYIDVNWRLLPILKVHRKDWNQLVLGCMLTETYLFSGRG